MAKISLNPLMNMKNIGQPKRSQAYYDNIAKELENGIFSYNPKTGNTTYSTKNRSTVLKGFWDKTQINYAKHRVMSKYNPNPSVEEIAGRDNIITYVSNSGNDVLPISNCYINTKPLSFLA